MDSSSRRHKAGLARSLLHKVSTKTEDLRPDTATASASSASPSSDKASDSASPISTSPSNPSQLRKSFSARDLPNTSLSATSTASPSGNAAHIAAAAASATMATSTQPSAIPAVPMAPPTLPKGASIESSVRLFRLYEALRSGDTAAITRGIKESVPNVARTDDAGAGERRVSTASAISQSGNASAGLEGTTVLHLAIQCAEMPVIEYVISAATPSLDVNTRDREGNTPLHIASMLSRGPVVRLLLEQKCINDSLTNYHGKTALDLARNPDIFQQLQLFRSVYIDSRVKELQRAKTTGDYERLEQLLTDPHLQSSIDVNGPELATESATVESGGTLLHEAARQRDTKLIQILLLNGADPFRRDRRGKLPQDVTKDDRTRAILKRSPAAAAAQRGIQERTILGSTATASAPGLAPGELTLGNKEGREFKGYLKKWTNYTSGYKLRWFVLEDGVMSYYKHQDDAGSACRGAINMRIAKLHMDPQDKLKFEIHGKSSVKYHLKANHQVEAKRWYWALNNAIQFAKDEAKEEARRQTRDQDMLRQAKLGQLERVGTRESDISALGGTSPSTARPAMHSASPSFSTPAHRPAASVGGDDDDAATASAYEPSVTGNETSRAVSYVGTTAVDGDGDDEEEFGDDLSSAEAKLTNKDAFMIAAQSARVQLELLAHISTALQSERVKNPDLALSDPTVAQALASYESAVGNLKGLISDLGRITRDREAFWQYRLEQETNVRRVWEESMTRIAMEQEELETRIGESEDKRKRTKRALRDALEGSLPAAGVMSPTSGKSVTIQSPTSSEARKPTDIDVLRKRRRSTIAEFTNLSDSESEDDEEFFDAVDAGEVKIVEDLPPSAPSPPVAQAVPMSIDATAVKDVRAVKQTVIQRSYKGYEDPIRKRLLMDADNRPRISLWGILKSMIGKDMTKMTLPVSFNEPTSLLQRVAEDMEYTDLLDAAAERSDTAERMVYVAAFAASEYASTIGRVAKPFNPLLGETYEYVRPDKGYRFFVEQVSHHPPIGAAWAESPNWDYYGESAVKSKFYGKSFDINPLGTWFLKLRPTNGVPSGYEELYTWKKVTSSVVGIITGNPTVDNYGTMEIKNWATNETCILDFKQRGWKASSAYQVTGRVLTADGRTVWSIGGRWNDKIYARYVPNNEDPSTTTTTTLDASSTGIDGTQAILIWSAHTRPTPPPPFNLTPFVITLNAIPENLVAHLPPTDTRRRPDQRAMEDGEYDLAATEKNRVEEKQRAARRVREQKGEEWAPKWFKKDRCTISGEIYWRALTAAEQGRGGGAGGNGSDALVGGADDLRYWASRAENEWSRCDDIF